MLLVIEISDLIFAVDSIPAIFAITTNEFIVYTSNVFAILGLRSLYFVLAGMMEKFHLLKAGLGIVGFDPASPKDFEHTMAMVKAAGVTKGFNFKF